MAIYYPNPSLQPSRLMLALGQYVAVMAAAGVLAWRASVSLPQDSRFSLTVTAVCVAWPLALFALIATLRTAEEAVATLQVMWAGVADRARATPSKSWGWTVVRWLGKLAVPATAILAWAEHYALAYTTLGIACTLAPIWVLVRGDGGLFWRIVMAILAVGMMAALVQGAIDSARALPAANQIGLLVTTAVLTSATYWWIERACISIDADSASEREA